MNYVLGLDVGIASVGWAVLELNEEDNPIRIEGLGARIFDKAEVPKTRCVTGSATENEQGNSPCYPPPSFPFAESAELS